MYDVIGVGLLCVDMINKVEKLPQTNETIYILDHSIQGGGLAATAIAAIARLGGKCGFLGRVGNDSYGAFCIKDFDYHGVDTSQIIVDDSVQTPFSVILAEQNTKNRTIIHYPGDARAISEKHINLDYIMQTKFLHLSSADPISVYCAEEAKKRNVTVVFDGDKYQPWIDTMLPNIDVFIGSDFYYQKMFSSGDVEANIREFAKRGPSTVVFTFGPKGCAGVSNGEFFTSPSFSVDVQDTLGAGDVFHGAFIFGLLQEWEITKVAQFASAVAAIKCTTLGGRAGIPDLKTTEEFLKTGKIDRKEIDLRSKHYKNGL